MSKKAVKVPITFPREGKTVTKRAWIGYKTIEPIVFINQKNIFIKPLNNI